MPLVAPLHVSRALHRLAQRPCRSAGQLRARHEALAILERESLARPVFGYRIWPLRKAPALAAMAHPGQRAVAAAACTLGAALEARVGALFRTGRRLVALELDAAGNELVYCLSRVALAAIGREAARGAMRMGNEVNPGDAGLALHWQEAVVALAAGNEHGVTATPAGMLWPLKSLSFIVPLGATLRASAGRRCSRCPSHDQCRATPG